MNEKKSDIVYSEPVREIISNPPKSIVRYGILVFAALFLMLIVFAVVIKYPDVIPAQIEITTENPPEILYAKVTGRINKLLVTDGQIVKKGQVLALLETAATLDDVSLLFDFIDSIKKPESISVTDLPDLKNLGELQSYYASFGKTIHDLGSFRSNDLYNNKVKVLEKEIYGLDDYRKRLYARENLLQGNLEIERSRFARDSLLNAEKLMADSEFEYSKESLIKIKLDLQQIRLDISKTSMELSSKEQQVNDYKIQKLEQQDKLTGLVNEAHQNLVAAADIWSKTYLLESNNQGRVSFLKYWSENQSVMVNEPVLSILPENAGNYIGRINLKMQRSGKVKPGMRVNIKLSGYPYLEYGMLRGEVNNISQVAAEGTYIIEVSLPDGLKTLYGNELELSQRMQGLAEIITDRQSLLRKILNPFRYLASSQK